MAEVVFCIAMCLLCLACFKLFKCAKLCTKEIELKFAKKPLGFKYARTWAEYWAECWTQCPPSWSSCFTSWWFRFHARGLCLLASEIGWAWLCDVLYVVFCFAHFPTRYVLQDPRKVSGILDEGCVKETGLPVKETKLHMDFSAFSESNFVFVVT